ncbi:MAG: YihY/virulence factor BrkB family protein [Mariprofundaceae bacterium]
MNERILQLKDTALKILWPENFESLPVWKAAFTRIMQIVYALTRDLIDGQLTLRGMSLVYTTLLSIVPLLALTFSVLKGFGVHNQLEPILLTFLAPLGEKGIEISSKIVEFVENIKVGVLGALGLGLLIYTVISLLTKIEKSFNYIWHVKETRRLGQRFSEYLSVIMVGPVLVFSALGITASMMNSKIVLGLMGVPMLGSVVAVAGKLVPYILVIAAFSFIYAFMPNTKVKLGAALVGGMISGVMWETTGWAFSSFIAGSTNYTAIYSGFAILIMFMIWLFISWLILLLGASIGFYFQHPEHLRLKRRELILTGRLLEKMSLLTMFYIARNYYRKLPEWDLEDLTHWLAVPLDVTQTVIKKLHDCDLIIPSRDGSPPYVPAMDLETIQVKQVLDAIRSPEENTGFNDQSLPSEPAVEALMLELDETVKSSLQKRTIKDLILSKE